MAYRIPYPKQANVTCERCQTIHIGVPVQFDEDGPYALLDTEPCAGFGCEARLCSACPQVEFGGLPYCPDCMTKLLSEGAQAAATARELELCGQDEAAVLMAVAGAEVTK